MRESMMPSPQPTSRTRAWGERRAAKCLARTVALRVRTRPSWSFPARVVEDILGLLCSSAAHTQNTEKNTRENDLDSHGEENEAGDDDAQSFFGVEIAEVAGAPVF